MSAEEKQDGTPADQDKRKVRDRLAYHRTTLANERTLLAYTRTGLALVAAGGTLLKFLGKSWVLYVVGIVLLCLGGLTLGAGVWRFIVVRRDIRHTYRKPSG